MIYGYLRVSTDKQDVKSQKQGGDKFAAAHGWGIDEYITDEGVSGGKDPSKRKLGDLLKKIGEYTYEQVYDTILCDEEFNTEYRKHGQLLVKRKHY